MKKKIIIAGVTAAVLIAGAGIFCVSAGNRENDKKTEITQMTEAESETEPITEVETTTESVTEAQTEAPTEPQTEQVTEPQTEQAEVDTFYDDTIDTYSYEEEDDTDDSAPADIEPADTQPVYEEPEPVHTEPEPVYIEPEPVSEDTDSGNTGVDNSQEDFYEDDDEEPYYGDESAYAAKLAEEIKDNIQPEDYDKIDWADRIGS